MCPKPYSQDRPSGSVTREPAAAGLVDSALRSMVHVRAGARQRREGPRDSGEGFKQVSRAQHIYRGPRRASPKFAFKICVTLQLVQRGVRDSVQ